MQAKDVGFIALILGLAGGLLWVYQAQPSIGYVRTAELLDNYEGMREAAELFDQKRSAWSLSLDSMKNAHDTEVDSYLAVKDQLSTTERTEREVRLGRSQQTIQQYQQAIEAKAAETDNSMTQGVLTQVSDFIEAYGKEHGYTVILGANADGGVLYGQEGNDLTTEITEALNAHYKGTAP